MPKGFQWKYFNLFEINAHLFLRVLMYSDLKTSFTHSWIWSNCQWVPSFNSSYPGWVKCADFKQFLQLLPGLWTASSFEAMPVLHHIYWLIFLQRKFHLYYYSVSKPLKIGNSGYWHQVPGSVEHSPNVKVTQRYLYHVLTPTTHFNLPFCTIYAGFRLHDNSLILAFPTDYVIRCCWLVLTYEVYHSGWQLIPHLGHRVTSQ